MSELPLLTASRMRAFRTCTRLHHFRYVEGWHTTSTPEALRFGSLMHAGLEAWWLTTQRNWNSCAAPQDIVSPLDEALAVVSGAAADPFEGVRAEELLRGYETRWWVESALYEVLAVEAEYRAPMWNPDTDRDSKTWQLAGKIDGIVRRRSDGRTLVMEHKTTVEAINDDTDHYWSTLALDPQISGYVIGAEALGHSVDEILYDVIRKPAQRPLLATPVEARKFTKDGRLYANQRAEDETLDEYRSRIRAAIEEAPDRYFQRRSIPRTQSQIRDYLVSAWAQSRAMRDLQLANVSYPNAEACHRFGECPLWKVCSTGSTPAAFPEDFVKVENVNPELGVKL